MTSRLLAMGVAGLTICCLRAEGSPAANATQRESGSSFVSVVRRPTGEPILVVAYPWKEHARPSIEVRAYGPDEADSRQIDPLYFVNNFMKGEVTVAVYKCQDLGGQTRTTAQLTKNEIDFEVIGERNSFGGPSATVACRTKYRISAAETVPRAIFPLLEPWSIEPQELYLDLPEAYFSGPVKLRIWMLRGKSVVWTETIRWPGPGK